MPPLRARMSGAWVTWTLIAVCIVVFVIQYQTGIAQGSFTNSLLFYPPYALSEPWRFITAVFAHLSLLHIASNMFSLFVLGSQLERLMGHWRFAVLYFLSGIGGGVAVMLLAPATPTAGASGAIFGLLGAFFIIARRLGGNVTQIIGLIVLNLAIGFIIPGIAWQAHVGGLVVGALVAFIYGRPRSPGRLSGSPVALLVLVSLALVVIAVIRGLAL
jgi:membrane associated rhomboid family serine protease